MSSRSSRRGSTQSQDADDDIIEITDVAPADKVEEERRFARQKEHLLNDDSRLGDASDADGNGRRRQKRTRRRHFHPDGRPMIFADDFEICDCLEPKCLGCHRPCKTCKDRRCGSDCRTNRRWVYETVDLEGRNKTLRHPHTLSDFF